MIYKIKVKHDKGTANIRLSASSPEEARRIIKAIEGCPDSAIISVELYESKRKRGK